MVDKEFLKIIKRQTESREIINIPEDIKKIIFNEPATIVLWKDGTKTVSKCLPEDTYDEKIGLALCVLKKIMVSNRQINQIIKKHKNKPYECAFKKKEEYTDIYDIDLSYKLKLAQKTETIDWGDIVYLDYGSDSNYYIIMLKNDKKIRIRRTPKSNWVLKHILER